MIEIILLVSSVLFIFALKLFGRPSTAHRANTFAMLAMALAVFSAFNFDFSKYDSAFYITIVGFRTSWSFNIKTCSDDTNARVSWFV
jgi:NAD/NADP transhydrogenase beta subunit